MTRCDLERLSRYVDGELDEDQARTVVEHVAGCASCRSELESLRELDALTTEVLPSHTFQVAKPLARRAVNWRRAAVVVAPFLFLSAAFAAVGVLLYVADETEPQATQVEQTPPVEGTARYATPDPPALHTGAQGITLAPPVTPPTVAGRVLNFDDEPLSDARVYVVEYSGSWPGAAPVVSKRIEVRKDGTFELPWPPRDSEISVHADGYLPESFGYGVINHNTAATVTIRLFRPYPVSGRVFDPQGRPLSDALVHTVGSAIQQETRSAVSDEDGRYLYAGIARPTQVLWVSHENYAETSVTVHEDGSVDDARLTPGGALRVAVFHGDQPLAGAIVLLHESGSNLPRESRTDAQGIYVFEHLPAGTTYAIQARTDAGEVSGLPESPTLVFEGETTDSVLRIPWHYPGRLSGRIADEAGVGLTGARLKLSRSPVPELSRIIRTDGEGRFEAPLLAGETIVNLSLSGHWLGSGAQERESIIVSAEGEEHELNYTAIPWSTEQMQVRLIADGLPVSYALIPAGSWGVETLLNLPDGVFTAVRRHQVIAADPVTNLAGVMMVPSDENPVISLEEPVARVLGEVADEQGRPIPGVRIELQTAGSFWRRAVVESNARGRFATAPLGRAGNLQIEAFKAGYLQSGVKIVESEPGSRYASVGMVMTGAEISGQVVSEDGLPCAGAEVHLIVGGDQTTTVDVGSDGSFRLQAPSGPQEIMATYGPGNASDRVRVRAPASGMVLVVPVTLGGTNEAPEEIVGEYDRQEVRRVLQRLGLAMKMFANESRGERYPVMSREPGAFLPAFDSLYPEYLADESLVRVLRGDTGMRFVYTGYLLAHDEEGEAFLDVYESIGPDYIHDKDVLVGSGKGNGNNDTVFRLREGVERFLITDINDIGASARRQSEIPVFWEMPEHSEEPGGQVLFLDGHVEWIDYPGRFPMTESFIERLQTILTR